MKRIDIIFFLPVLIILSGCMAGHDMRDLQTAKQLRVSSMSFYGRTNDVLLWYGVDYMMSKSPLSGFKDYKTVFGELTSNPSDPTSPIDWDKNYKAKWIIMSRYLYLYDIEILEGAEKYPKKRSVLEKLTHQTFQEELHILPEYPEGVLFASWFSDTIYLKRFPEPDESYCDPKYRCESFKMFIFKEGRLVREKLTFHVDILIDSVEIYTNPLKYSVNQNGIRRYDPCTNHLTEALEEGQYLKEGFFARSNDELEWHDTIFLVGESPLSFFDNYKKIYPNVPEYEIKNLFPNWHEKNYMPKWTIVNGLLYLLDIDFLGRNDKFLDPEYEKKRKEPYDREYPIRFQAVEDLTGKKFLHLPALNKKAIFADWFSGTLFIKRYPEKDEDPWGGKYKNEPFYKLVFENGIIVSKETTNYMIVKRNID